MTRSRRTRLKLLLLELIDNALYAAMFFNEATVKTGLTISSNKGIDICVACLQLVLWWSFAMPSAIENLSLWRSNTPAKLQEIAPQAVR
jgi:hypothetical protein